MSDKNLYELAKEYRKSHPNPYPSPTLESRARVYMKECNLAIVDDTPLHIDGRIHRYQAGSEYGSKAKDQWYIGDYIGEKEVVITFGTWRGEQEKYTYRSWKGDENLTEEGLSFREEQYKEIRQKQFEEEKKRQKVAVEEIRSHWGNTQEADSSHPYLKKKKVGIHGIKQAEQKLVVPRYDSTGQLMSVQTIDHDGVKRNAAGAPCKNTFHIIGKQDKPKRIRFCEGYATGATIHETTGDMVVCCFSCGNIMQTTFLVREKHPNAYLVLNADKNTEKLCEQWKQTYKGEVQIPVDCEKTDFNDLYIEKGKEGLLSQIELRKLKAVKLFDFLSDPRVKEEKPVLTYQVSGKNIPIITDTSITLLYSSAGVGKTWVMNEIYAAAGAGQPLFKFNFARPFKVALIDLEMSPYSAKTRMLEVFQRRDIDDDKNFDYFNRAYESIKENKSIRVNLNNKKDRSEIDEIIENNEVILIDNLQNCMDTVGERDSQQISHEAMWNEVSDWLMEWKFKGKTFFIAHHENKGGVMKGSGRIKDDIDYQIHLTRPKIIPVKGFAVVYQFEKTRNAPQQIASNKMLAYKNPDSKWFAKWDITPYED